MKTEQLQSVILVLTNKCNLKCRYCFQNSSPDVDTSNELKREEWFDIINQLAKMGVSKISLSGGEPLTHKNFLGILKYIFKRKIDISIYTNGLLITKKGLKKFKDYRVRRLIINFSSPNKETHDFYKKKGCWKKALDIIVLAKKNSLEVEVAITLTKKVFREIDDCIPFCIEKLKIDEITYAPLLSVGRMSIKNEFLNKQEKEEFDRKIQSYRNKYPHIKIGTPCEICEAGKSYCAIQPNGNVTPCITMPNLVAGNVKEKPLSEIWYNSKLFREIRRRKTKGDECLSALLLNQNVL